LSLIIWKKAQEVKMGKFSRMALGFMMAMIVTSPAFLTGEAWAEAKKPTPVEGAMFDVSFPLKESLKSFQGKDVQLILRSGQTIQGYVKAVGDHFVHLEKLAGKDFYDALVRMEDISAIEAKFREMK
jgi:hypothetical protein